MVETPDDILILESRVEPTELARVAAIHFEGMVKYVVDVERRLIALGGAMHAGAVERLLELGSRQQDLWGANYYPGRGPEACIEFVSLINIRPRAGNRSIEIQDPLLRPRVAEITFALIGTGEEEGWPPSTPT